MSTRAVRLLIVVSLFALELTGPSRYERVGAHGVIQSYGPGELIKRFRLKVTPCDENRPHLHKTSCRVVPVDQAWQRRETPPVPLTELSIELPRAARHVLPPVLSTELHPVVPFHLESKK